MLENLFGINKVQSKAIRLNEIYSQCEAAWDRNLDRLGNRPVTSKEWNEQDIYPSEQTRGLKTVSCRS